MKQSNTTTQVLKIFKKHDFTPLEVEIMLSCCERNEGTAIELILRKHKFTQEAAVELCGMMIQMVVEKHQGLQYQTTVTSHLLH